MAKFTRPLESATRIKINNWLVNLGWDINESSPTCNCFTERARTIEENKKFKGSKPDYVLYYVSQNFLFILFTKDILCTGFSINIRIEKPVESDNCN